MSQPASPISAVFDAQRAAIKQGGQALKQGLAAQRGASRMALTGLKGQESLQRQSLQLARATTHAYMDAWGAMAGNQRPHEQRRAVDETFSRLEETHSQFFDAFEREFDRVVESFDEVSNDYFAAIDRQTDQLLGSHQTAEDQMAQNVDEFSRQLREQLERTQEMQDQLEDQFEEQAQQAEALLRQQNEQAEKFQAQLEEQAQQMQRGFRSQVEASQQGGEGGHPPQAEQAGRQPESEVEHQLETIDGLGPTFRERLSEAGITTIDELVEAGPEAVAEAADVSRDRAASWIEAANP